METDNPQEKPKKVKKKKVSRTVETMFRSTMTNQIRLSEMADRKASLLVSINAIILSVMVSLMVHEVLQTPVLLLPTAALVLVCLFTILFALLSTKPSLNVKHHGTTPHTDLLFFRDYVTLTAEQYKEAMKEMMAQEERLHDGLIENIYAQGEVIDKKYKLLKVAYYIFMIGFSAVLLGYLLTLYLYLF
jgi:hypothetical protein